MESSEALVSPQADLGALYLEFGYGCVVERFASVAAPTPLEHFYYAVALTALGRNEEAKIPFYIAVRAGYASALIGLIGAYTVLGEFAEAEVLVEQARGLNLTPVQTVALIQAEGELLYARGQPHASLRLFKRAWLQLRAVSSFSIEDALEPHGNEVFARFELWRASRKLAFCAQNIFNVSTSCGRFQEAADYLSEALQFADNGLRWSLILNISLASCDVSLGNVERAEQRLAGLHLLPHEDPVVYLYYLTVKTQLLVVQGRFREALNASLYGFSLANDLHVNDLKHQLACRLVALHVAMDQLDDARRAVFSLGQLEVSAQSLAHRKLRQATLFQARGDFVQAATLLNAVVLTFTEMECSVELAQALLRLACLQVETELIGEASSTLDHLSDIVAEFGGFAFLCAEYSLIGAPMLGRLASIASSYARRMLDLEPGSPVSTATVSAVGDAAVSVQSFGSAQMFADGRNITPRANKAMELAVFLLIQPCSSLQEIIDSLFSGSSLDKASTYFHVAKHRFNADCVPLAIVHDKRSKLYSLLVPEGLALEFDYGFIGRLLELGDEASVISALDHYVGVFLPRLEGDWVDEIRRRLDWELVRSCLRVVTALFESQRFTECRALAARLLRFSPFDPVLTELIVASTREVDGLLAGRGELRYLQSSFEREFGELPPNEALDRRIVE